jgi:hypothetical protein
VDAPLSFYEVTDEDHLEAMNRADVERIVRSVIRQYGLDSTIRRITLFSHDWNIELVNATGARTTLTVADSSPQHLRSSLIAALDLEPE